MGFLEESLTSEKKSLFKGFILWILQRYSDYSLLQTSLIFAEGQIKQLEERIKSLENNNAKEETKT